MEDTARARLLVDDKRRLYSGLVAMADRLLFLNKFPEDQYGFALSLETPETQNAIRHMEEHHFASLNKRSARTFFFNDWTFNLHCYPGEANGSGMGYRANHIFISTTATEKENRTLLEDNPFFTSVSNWCKKQKRLEDQILRCDGVIKDIVTNCNTIGQYARVSPEIIPFLPDKYRDALRDYSKRSPYPQLCSSTEEIETAISTLAFAALQPQHHAEMHYERSTSWRWHRYEVGMLPCSDEFLGSEVRHIDI